MAIFVLSVLGDDQSGLVEALSGVVAERGGNWDRSHLTQLSGKFAGLVMVTIPDREIEAFRRDLEPLEKEGLFDITLQAASPVERIATRTVVLELVGNDHPGIVHDLASLLADQGVSFDDLETSTSNAPMAGGTLFHAKAILQLPSDLSVDALVDGLEALAADLMVEIDVADDVGV